MGPKDSPTWERRQEGAEGGAHGKKDRKGSEGPLKKEPSMPPGLYRAKPSIKVRGYSSGRSLDPLVNLSRNLPNADDVDIDERGNLLVRKPSPLQ